MQNLEPMLTLGIDVKTGESSKPYNDLTKPQVP